MTRGGPELLFRPINLPIDEESSMKLAAIKANGKILGFAACAGLAIGTMGGCDEDVNAILVEGMNLAAQTAAVTLIDAGFQMVTPETEPYNNNTGGGEINPVDTIDAL